MTTIAIESVVWLLGTNRATDTDALEEAIQDHKLFKANPHMKIAGEWKSIDVYEGEKPPRRKSTGSPQHSLLGKQLPESSISDGPNLRQEMQDWFSARMHTGLPLPTSLSRLQSDRYYK